MSGNGHVVANPARREGLGTRLLEVGEAVWLGGELGRTVIVDWRNTVFLEDTALNYFAELFAPLPEILGVPMDYAPSPATREYEQCRKDERLKLKPDVLARLVSEFQFRWDDAELGVPWPAAPTHLSQRDREAQPLSSLIRQIESLQPLAEAPPG